VLWVPKRSNQRDRRLDTVLLACRPCSKITKSKHEHNATPRGLVDDDLKSHRVLVLVTGRPGGCWLGLDVAALLLLSTIVQRYCMHGVLLSRQLMPPGSSACQLAFFLCLAARHWPSMSEPTMPKALWRPLPGGLCSGRVRSILLALRRCGCSTGYNVPCLR
jgi:hypothetical protein